MSLVKLYITFYYISVVPVIPQILLENDRKEALKSFAQEYNSPNQSIYNTNRSYVAVISVIDDVTTTADNDTVTGLATHFLSVSS